MQANDRLALALDTDDTVEALRWARDLRDVFGVAKVGLELFTSEGPSIIFALREMGYRVFLDLKLHDIPTTVYRCARVIGGFGVELVTLHVQGGSDMLKAGVEGLGEGARASGTAIIPVALGVTFLTSDPKVDPAVFDQRLETLYSAGCRGFVSSSAEVAGAKALFPDLLSVVPGIRFGGAQSDDQSRIATPSAAFAQGADLLVVGRSITRAPDRAKAIKALEAELAAI